MTTMLERVASTYWDAAFSDTDKYSTLSLHNQYVAQEGARAAIKAMREPTEEMRECGYVHWDYSCNVCGGLKEGWYAMIDAALKEMEYE
jgi:hypothetical protein